MSTIGEQEIHMKVKNRYGELLSVVAGNKYQVDSEEFKQYEGERVTGTVEILETPTGKYVLVNSMELNANVLLPVVELITLEES